MGWQSLLRSHWRCACWRGCRRSIRNTNNRSSSRLTSITGASNTIKSGGTATIWFAATSTCRDEVVGGGLQFPGMPPPIPFKQSSYCCWGVGPGPLDAVSVEDGGLVVWERLQSPGGGGATPVHLWSMLDGGVVAGPAVLGLYADEGGVSTCGWLVSLGGVLSLEEGASVDDGVGGLLSLDGGGGFLLLPDPVSPLFEVA
jgi:hypothetical protein